MAKYDDLVAAVTAGDSDAVCTLLEDPSITSRPAEGPSVLLAALFRGRQDLVLLLAPHIHKDIFEAAALGDTNRVRQLVESDRKLSGQYTADGWTPLHLAAFTGHREAAEALLESGADLRAVSKNSTANQPLHAALAGKTDRGLVEMLLERGADPKARGGGGVTPLHLAASRGDWPLCELLIEKGADAAAKMDDGTTPAAIAKQRGHEAVAKQLQGYLR